MRLVSWRARVRALLPFIFAAIFLFTGFWLRVSASRSTARGYVLGPGEGEALDVPNGRIVIKVDPKTGSQRMAMGMQTLAPGKGIALHLHEQEDEILFLHGGTRTVIVGHDQRVAVTGTTVYIPHGVWHGVENSSEQAQVVWLVSPPGLEDYFREVGTAPGMRVKEFTPERLAEIRRKHGMKSR
jgi:quercetin dioxygenase-like cupin family protein